LARETVARNLGIATYPGIRKGFDHAYKMCLLGKGCTISQDKVPLLIAKGLRALSENGLAAYPQHQGFPPPNDDELH
jgi:hypothetical protein